MRPLVSIIMPLYNCSEYVMLSVKSVVAQTYRDWELLIVDDKSADNSYQVVHKFAKKDPRIKLYQLPQNSGVAYARNFAIEHAQGQIIAFLDSDDLWLPNKLESQILFMQENHALLSFTGYKWIDERGKILKEMIHVPKSVNYTQLLQQNVIGCLTAMYDSSKIGKFYFDISLKKHEDFQYWLEILKKIPNAYGLDVPLSYYRVRNNSLSSNKVIAASYVWKILREYQKIPFLKALYYFNIYIVRSIIKYYGK